MLNLIIRCIYFNFEMNLLGCNQRIKLKKMLWNGTHFFVTFGHIGFYRFFVFTFVFLSLFDEERERNSTTSHHLATMLSTTGSTAEEGV